MMISLFFFFIAFILSIIISTKLSNFKFYRKFKGGIWYYFIKEFILNKDNGEIEKEVYVWSKIKPKSSLILKIEIYD